MLQLFVGMDNSVGAAKDSTVSQNECSDSVKGESNLVGEKLCNCSKEKESPESCKLLMEKVIFNFLPLLGLNSVNQVCCVVIKFLLVSMLPIKFICTIILADLYVGSL